MTRFAGELDVFNQVKNLKDLRSEGSIPYLTPYMSSQQEPSYSSGGGTYWDFISDKTKELDDIVEASDPWAKPEEPDPVDPDPDPVTPDPEPEIDPEKKAAQEKWKGIWANQIAEGISMDDAMRSSRTVTPEEWEDYKWAFSEDTDLNNWKKIGGGNKMGSGGGAVNAARRAQAASGKSGPGLGFAVGQAVRGVKARFSDTQGRNMESNPSYRGHM
jgi:hypothetical protein